MSGTDAAVLVGAAPAVFDIFVLGTRSSGKSVLLASLYRQLSSMDGITNFFARCDDPEQHRELCDNYDELLDTEADWPAGTYSVDSYDLQCFHRLRGKSLPVFSIRFHDYPGGYVSNQIERRDFIEERAAQCNSAMALIDGRKLRDRLDDCEDNPAHSLHRDLDSLVRVLQQCVGKPIHFILTKADLLPPAKYPLKDIIAELKRHKGFSDILAQQCDAETTCYLIPVSAVGPNFAVLDPADGVIRKRGNGTIEPFHFDVMTSVSMVDTVFDLARRNADLAVQPAVGLKVGLAARLKGKLGKKLSYARMLAPAAIPVFGHLGVLGLMALSAASENFIADKNRGLEEKTRQIRQGIHDQASAIEAILKIQYQLLDRYLKRFPMATLGARFDPAAQLAPFDDDPARGTNDRAKRPKAAPTDSEAQRARFELYNAGDLGFAAEELQVGLNVLGREPRHAGNPIVVSDDFVSKDHAVLEVIPEKPRSVYLCDIGTITGKSSTNGVYLNDAKERLEGRVEVRAGDRIQIGKTTLILRRCAVE